eukprot:143796-Prymnesium_polylepis.1
MPPPAAPGPHAAPPRARRPRRQTSRCAPRPRYSRPRRQSRGRKPPARPGAQTAPRAAAAAARSRCVHTCACAQMVRVWGKAVEGAITPRSAQRRVAQAVACSAASL